MVAISRRLLFSAFSMLTMASMVCAVGDSAVDNYTVAVVDISDDVSAVKQLAQALRNIPRDNAIAELTQLRDNCNFKILKFIKDKITNAISELQQPSPPIVNLADYSFVCTTLLRNATVRKELSELKFSGGNEARGFINAFCAPNSARMTVADLIDIGGRQVPGDTDGAKKKKLMLRFHPDQVNKLSISEESKKTAEAIFKVISNAYDSQGSNPVAELADELDQLADFRNELVYAANHLYEINEVPHIDDIKDYFVNNRQKDLFAKRDEIFSQWKQFYLIKSGSTAALYAAISYFRNSSDGRMKAIKDRIEKFEKEHGKISKGLKIGGKLSLSLIMGAFPLYYLNIFRLASIDENYKSVTDPDGKVRAYYQKVYSHSTYSGNVETKYYIVHFPHGYMKPDEVHDKFMPLRKTQMMAMFSAVASAFGAALPWVL